MRIQEYQQSPGVYERKENEDVRMVDYQQAPRVHQLKNMRMWVSEDTNKHIEHTSLSIREWKDMSLLGTTHEPDDMRMQGYKWGHMHLRIWGCKDAMIQASTHEHKDIGIRGCTNTSKDTET